MTTSKLKCKYSNKMRFVLLIRNFRGRLAHNLGRNMASNTVPDSNSDYSIISLLLSVTGSLPPPDKTDWLASNLDQNEVCRLLCDKVFLPAVQKNYLWLRDKIQVGRKTTVKKPTEDSAEIDEGGDEEEQSEKDGDGDGDEEEQSEKDGDGDADEEEQWGSRLAGFYQEKGINAEEPAIKDDEMLDEDLPNDETTDRKSLKTIKSHTPSELGRDQIYQFAFSELWYRFSGKLKPDFTQEDLLDSSVGEEDKVSGTRSKSVWQSALEAALTKESPDAQEKYALLYLRLCAKNAMNAFLGESDLDRNLYNRLQESLSSLVLDNILSKRSSSTFYVPVDHLKWKPNPALIPLEAWDGETRTPKGSSRFFQIMLPEPAQISELLVAAFKKCRCALSTNQMMTLIFKAFDLGAPVQVDLPEEPANGDGDGPGQPKAGIQEKPIAGGQVVQEPAEIPEEQKERYARIQALKQSVISAIEKKDRKPIDPPNPKKRGRLGRLFLDYFIWREYKISHPETKSYTFEVYATWSNSVLTTENDRFNNVLKPLLQRVMISEMKAETGEAADMLILFREDYWHRKPEFVDVEHFS